MREPGGPKICEPGGHGLFLPSSDGEQHWPSGIRGILYGFAMAYCFLGVSIVADTFMGSIEVVTSRKRQIRLKGGRLLTYRVWNDTVANLTLMALGSSAPEILLSVIELVKNGMYSGDLGPSTIVGSAAFNLLVIISLCISVIPRTEIRKVKELPVLYITVVFSIFAYIWLVVIISVISPDIVDVWEAIVTFLCFPVLVWIAWLADTGLLGSLTRKRATKLRLSNTGEVPEHIVQQICDTLGARDSDTVQMIKKNISASNIGPNPSSSELEALILTLSKQQAALGTGPSNIRKSRATHRMEATRAFTGSRRVVSGCQRTSSSGNERDPEFSNGKMNNTTTNSSSSTTASMHVNCEMESTDNYVQFARELQCLSKGLFSKTILVVRGGDNTFDLTVEYSVHLPQEMPVQMLHSNGSREVETFGRKSGTSNHSAFLSNSPIGLGQEVACGTMLFQAGERSMEIVVQKPSVLPGSEEDFLVHLKGVEVADPAVRQRVAIGTIRTTQVTPGLAGVAGRLSFMSERLPVQGTSQTQVVEVTALRKGGCSGAVSCSYTTEKMNAIPGRDYSEAEGTLEFAEGVTEQIIYLEILPKSVHQWSDELLLVLKDPQGGAEFDPNDDGGPDSAIITVTINALDVISQAPSLRVLRWLDRKLNFDELRVGSADWCDQFTSAAFCNGSREEQREASFSDWFFHIVSLPWKMLFTLVPPTTFCNGWVCFYTSLCFIGLVTAVIGDLAELFGCVLDVPDAVTAITFVALGTSMPDLFASHSAAIQDPWADASICNVTGSNSVNVFLGLGLPWTMGSLYWSSKDRSKDWEDRYPDVAGKVSGVVFVVPSGNLGFSVLVFAGASLVALGLLQLRRVVVGAELGGPFGPKASTSAAFVTLWFAYITLASWQVLRNDKADKLEYVLVFVITMTIAGSVVVVPVVLLLRYVRNPEELERYSMAVSGNEDTDGDIDSLGGTGDDSEGKQEQFRSLDIAGNSLEATLAHRQNGNGNGCSATGTHEDEFPAKSVDPPDVAAGPPVLPEGAPPFAQLTDVPQPALAVVNTESPQSPRSPPPGNQEETGNSEWPFVDRQVVQPPATPFVELDLMSPALPAIQDASVYGMMDRRPPQLDNATSPIAHLPNLTRDASFIDRLEGSRRADSPTSHQHWAQLLPAHEQAASVIGAAQLRGRGDNPVQNYSLSPASSALGAAHMSPGAPSSPGMSKAKFSL